MHTALQFPVCSRSFSGASRANRRSQTVLPTVLPPVLSFPQRLGRSWRRRVLPPFRDLSARAGRAIPNSIRAIHTVRVGVPFAAFIGIISQRPFPSKSISVLLNYRDRWRNRLKRAAVGVPLRHWQLGFKECTFHHAHRSCGASGYTLSPVTAFPGMLLSPSCFHSR